MGFSMRATGQGYLEPVTEKVQTWSHQQKDIFDWFANGSGNLVIRARSGCGKTTTIVEGVNHATENNILMAAFNKKIATHMSGMVSRNGGRAEVKTLHSVGFSIVHRYWQNVKLDADRGFQLARQAAGESAPDEISRKIARLAGMAKGCVARFDPNCEVLMSQLVGMAIRHDLEPEEDWQRDGWTTERIAGYSMKAMALALRRNDTIDFDDMLFLPVANNWAKPRYDLVVIDEAQDMNLVQIELAMRVLTPGGRVCVVGDDRQAIYAFRGADASALDRLKKELQAAELGLTKTYRCGKVIVDYARRLVPDFEAAEQNSEGVIDSIDKADLVNEAMEGDFILSRKNAPLASICLRLLRARKRARIEGKDIGNGLKTIARRWKPKTIAGLQDSIGKWKGNQIDRLLTMNTRDSRAKAEVIADQAEILLALCDGLGHPSELITRIDSMFSDSGEDRRPTVVCSSIHKSKGLEAKRVFILKGTLYPKRWKSKDDMDENEEWAQRQAMEEANLEYVAVTRAIETLVWVE